MGTLNQEYNELLKQWEEETGEVFDPECEECQCDLIGKEVFKTDTLWLCRDCMYDYYGL